MKKYFKMEFIVFLICLLLAFVLVSVICFSSKLNLDWIQIILFGIYAVASIFNAFLSLVYWKIDNNYEKFFDN